MSRADFPPLPNDGPPLPPSPPPPPRSALRRGPDASEGAESNGEPARAPGAEPDVEGPALPPPPPQAPSGALDDEEPEAPPVARPPVEIRRGLLHRAGALLGSAVAHLVVLLVLALWFLPPVILHRPDVLLVELPGAADEPPPEVTIATELREAGASSIFSQSSLTGSGVEGVGGGLAGDLSLDPRMVARAATATEVDIGGLAGDLPDTTTLIAETPDGALGDPRVIADNYDQAMDRITQEIVWMLSRSNVLLIWCFDQSESMKDDQQEIRARIQHVYQELGLRGQTGNDALATAVTSYGSDFAVHTRRPTADVEEIEAAIESVPVDPSGKEMMCAAVQASIARHLDYARTGKRQMALVLVTDETGDAETNVQHLESTISLARQAPCRVYTLGREAVFGYPFAHMRWRHPFTGQVHWLPIDRGPEAAFVQQLQTDGFRRRYDAHPSGFGPYEQTRLARETGGIFFMLPSLETRLVRGEKRRYELEAMRAYRPDLRSRQAINLDRDGSELRRTLFQIINDLNPYDPRVAEVMEVRFTFSARPEQFARQVRQEQAKIKAYLVYLDAAAAAIRDLRLYREQETSPRWQANYDLIRAQLLAYTARSYEYAAYLEQFLRNPKPVPLEKPNMVRLSHWDIAGHQETVGGEVTAPYIREATAGFEDVVRYHPGTPWSARATQELARGYGWVLNERYSYYGPRKSTPRPSHPQIPIPKL